MLFLQRGSLFEEKAYFVNPLIGETESLHLTHPHAYTACTCSTEQNIAHACRALGSQEATIILLLFTVYLD